MEILTLLLVIVILIILLSQSGNNLSRQISRLEAEIDLLRNYLIKQKKEEEKAAAEKFRQQEPQPVKNYWESGFQPVEEKNPATIIPTVVEEPKPAAVIEPEPVKPAATDIIEEAIVQPSRKAVPPITKKPTPSFFERHPDMEKFIGENLISKIGIAILVLAIGFFVKYAIDQDWIGPTGRVAIGIVCGGVLVGLAHRLRNIYTGFSSVLAGGGLAVFYFTIYLAYQQFHLFSQTVSFVIMTGITAFAVALSLLYRKQELAIIALVGGFAAPFLVSDGSGNYKVLFSYLIILNAGLLVIAYFKSWRLLNLLSFIFTVVLFGGWLFGLYNATPAVYTNAFIFSTIFYVLFFAINIAHNIKANKAFIASDFGILLANTALYFTDGIYCLHQLGASEWQGTYSIAMAVFNLAASFIFFKRRKVDKNILYLLIGITLTFISITAPIQLSGNNITIFWASEAVLLYWLYKKSRIEIIQYSSLIIWLLMLVSLFMDLVQTYLLKSSLPIIVNKGFITTAFAAIGTYVLFLLLKKDQDKSSWLSTVFPARGIFRVVAIILLFIAGGLEINFQFRFYYPDTAIYSLYLLLYVLSFISLLTLITQKIQSLQLSWELVAVLFSVSIIFYLFSIPADYAMLEEMLLTGKNTEHFMAHWASAIIAASLIYRLASLIESNRSAMKGEPSFAYWMICIATVILLSVEFNFLASKIFCDKNNTLGAVEKVYVKAGLPILWGICSFIFMWLGMRFKFRLLRIVSLTIFTITLLKLFIFDITDIPAAGKIAAFFCLGVLLLVVSFMYQRLKKIIIDDEKIAE